MLRDILEEHLDEIEDLFERRLLYLDMLDVTSRDLRMLDERLRAHLDGLLLGGEVSWALCRDYLAQGGVGRAYMAAMLAFEGGDPVRLDELEAALTRASPEARQGIRWAACLTPWQVIDVYLMRLLTSHHPETRAVALDALTAHGIDPGKPLITALQSPVHEELLAALRGAGRLRDGRLQRAVEMHILSEHPDIAAATLETLVLLEPAQAGVRCRAVLNGAAACPAMAASLLGVMGKADDIEILAQASLSPDRAVARAAILALGNIGDTGAVPWLIDSLTRPKTAGVAGVALQWMFGADCPNVLAAPEPVNEDALEDAWHPDDDLPRLEAEAVAQWWQQHETVFPAGMRWRDARPLQKGAAGTEVMPLGLVRMEQYFYDDQKTNEGTRNL